MKQVMELVRQGVSQNAIERTLGIGRRTVRRWRRRQLSRACSHPRSSSVERFGHYLQDRWQQGCHDATRLWKAMRQPGPLG